jgi:hypothetical protein
MVQEGEEVEEKGMVGKEAQVPRDTGLLILDEVWNRMELTAMHSYSSTFNSMRTIVVRENELLVSAQLDASHLWNAP